MPTNKNFFELAIENTNLILTFFIVFFVYDLFETFIYIPFLSTFFRALLMFYLFIYSTERDNDRYGESDLELNKQLKRVEIINFLLVFLRLIKTLGSLIALVAAVTAFKGEKLEYVSSELGVASAFIAIVSDLPKDLILEPWEKKLENSIAKKYKELEDLRNANHVFNLSSSQEDLVPTSNSLRRRDDIPLQRIVQRINTASQLA